MRTTIRLRDTAGILELLKGSPPSAHQTPRRQGSWRRQAGRGIPWPDRAPLSPVRVATGITCSMPGRAP